MQGGLASVAYSLGLCLTTPCLMTPSTPLALRRRVLDAWAASPARFREDANAEEDYALGGYRDRVVVELAQNAADAAARAGVPGRLRLALRADGTLTADNTGAPLDVAGVEGSRRYGPPASGMTTRVARSAGSASGSRPWSRCAMSRGWSRVPERSSGRGRGRAT